MSEKEYECPKCRTLTKELRIESISTYTYYCTKCQRKFEVEKPPRYVEIIDSDSSIFDTEKNKKLSNSEVIKRLNVMNERIKLLQSQNNSFKKSIYGD